MLRRILLSVLVMSAFFGCDAVDGENNGVFIRVRNNSDLTFQQVTLRVTEKASLVKSNPDKTPITLSLTMHFDMHLFF